MESVQQPTTNELLRRFLTAPDEAESAALLEELLARAAQIIESIIHRKLLTFQSSGFQFTREDAEDLRGECLFNLVNTLRKLKEPAAENRIDDFPAYVAVVAYNECSRFWRTRVRQFERLRNKIKYLLRHEPSFALWQDDAELWWCALRQSEWYEKGIAANETPAAKVSREHIVALVAKHEPNYAQAHLLDLMTAVFAQAAGALRLSEAIGIAAQLWSIQDLPDRSLDEMQAAGIEPAAELSDQQRLLERTVELRALWQAIQELPPRQRYVTLGTLQDDDGHELLTAFFDSGIAHIPDLARALQVSADEVYELMPRLPLADNKLAESLQLSRQQVYNLRKSARDFLQRRLAGKQRRKRDRG